MAQDIRPLLATDKRVGARQLGLLFGITPTRLNETLICSKGTVRNAAVLAEDGDSVTAVSLTRENGNGIQVRLNKLAIEPVAIVECKRVGVEEGMKKGPQSIEKAKQGAYVARSVSRSEEHTSELQSLMR